LELKNHIAVYGGHNADDRNCGLKQQCRLTSRACVLDPIGDQQERRSVRRSSGTCPISLASNAESPLRSSRHCKPSSKPGAQERRQARKTRPVQLTQPTEITGTSKPSQEMTCMRGSVDRQAGLALLGASI
jgi:hypothetical protein